MNFEGAKLQLFCLFFTKVEKKTYLCPVKNTEKNN